MATIVTRSGKGSELTHAELDANFTNLNEELAGKQASLTVATQAEMEAGTESALRAMSPLRVKQAIAAPGHSLSGLTLNDGYTEEIFDVTGTTPSLSPTNGSIQTWTLSGASTPTAGAWANGQSITLLIDDGTARTITWTSLAVTWKTNGGSAPTLLTTGLTVIQLWKVGNVIYGARVGDA